MVAASTASRLDRLVIEIADAWIEAWASDLARERRSMCGGWPGTLREARERVAHAVRSMKDSGTLEEDVLERLTRRTYDEARARWRSRASRETE